MKVKQFDLKIARAKELIKTLRQQRHEALIEETRNKKERAVYKVGDIVTYPNKTRTTWDGNSFKDDKPKTCLLLITRVEFDSDGIPDYSGLVIIEGKVSRLPGNTRSAYLGRDKDRAKIKVVATVDDLTLRPPQPCPSE